MRALALLMLMVAACRQGGEAAPGVAPAPVVAVELPTLTLAQVEAQVGQPGVYLFDANPKDFYEHGHLPGARWVKFDAPAQDVLPGDHGATLIFYCANELCTASHAAARAAVAMGYAHVFVMPEGFIGWKKSGRALVRPDGG